MQRQTIKSVIRHIKAIPPRQIPMIAPSDKVVPGCEGPWVDSEIGDIVVTVFVDSSAMVLTMLDTSPCIVKNS